MIRELVSRDRWQAIGAVILGLLVLPLTIMSLESPKFSHFSAAYVFFTIASVVRLRERATAFRASLPICGRDLLMARLILVALSIWCLVPLGMLIVLIWRPDQLQTAAASLVETGAIFTLITLGTHSVQTNQLKGPRWPMFLGGPALVAASLYVPAPIFLTLCIVGCGVLLQLVNRRAPQGFLVGPEQVSDPWFRFRPNLTAPFASWPIVRGMVTGQTLWFVLIARPDVGWFLPALVPPAFVNRARKRSQWLFTLPYSRRSILLMLLAPALIALAFVGLSGNLWARLQARAGMVRVGYGPRWNRADPGGTGTRNVQVPYTFWRWSADPLPVIQAPWGEKAEPQPYNLLGYALYNPYAVGPENSQRFLEWQFERATQDIVGRSIPLAESETLKTMRLLPITQRPANQLLATIFLLSIGLLELVFYFVASRTRAAHLKRPLALWKRALGYGPIVLQITAAVTYLPASIYLLYSEKIPVELSITVSPEVIALHLLRAPNPQWTVALCCSIPMLLYFIAERIFLHIELCPQIIFPDDTAKKSSA
jgi:hypothetical protein